MNMRFTRENWRLFFTTNKKTTIRTKRKKTGHYTAVMGSRMKPQKLGEFDLVSCEEKLALLLNDEDAKNSGFETASELFDELSRLNGTSALMGSVYICHVENAERTILKRRDARAGVIAAR